MAAIAAVFMAGGSVCFLGSGAQAVEGSSSKSPEFATVVWEAELGAYQTADIPGFQCPTSHPWLIDKEWPVPPPWSPFVPRGVEAIPIGVFIHIEGALTSDPSGLVTGWADGNNSARNPSSFSHVVPSTVIAHCTNDPALAYSDSRSDEAWPASHRSQNVMAMIVSSAMK